MPSARRSASSPLHSAHTRPRRRSGPGCMHRIPKLLASNFEPDFDPCARPCPCGRQPKRSCEVCGGATASIICSAFGPAETFSPPQPVPCGPLRCRGALSSILVHLSSMVPKMVPQRPGPSPLLPRSADCPTPGRTFRRSLVPAPLGEEVACRAPRPGRVERDPQSSARFPPAPRRLSPSPRHAKTESRKKRAATRKLIFVKGTRRPKLGPRAARAPGRDARTSAHRAARRARRPTPPCIPRCAHAGNRDSPASSRAERARLAVSSHYVLTAAPRVRASYGQDYLSELSLLIETRFPLLELHEPEPDRTVDAEMALPDVCSVAS
jgi:hypothetical protein